MEQKEIKIMMIIVGYFKEIIVVAINVINAPILHILVMLRTLFTPLNELAGQVC